MVLWVSSALSIERREVLEAFATDPQIDARWGFMLGRKQVSMASALTDLESLQELLDFINPSSNKPYFASSCFKLKVKVSPPKDAGEKGRATKERIPG